MSAEDFLTDLARGLRPEERLILCGFPGDPYSAPPNAWRPRPWRPGADMPFESSDNAYVTVGAFTRAADGTYRRRTETFAAGLALSRLWSLPATGLRVPSHCAHRMNMRDISHSLSPWGVV